MSVKKNTKGNDLENLADYILRFQKYKKGNYKFKPINSIEDIVQTVKNGEKIVFVKNKNEAIGIFIAVGSTLILLLIMIIFTLDLIGTFGVVVLLIIFGSPLIVFLVLGFWYLRTSFIVLGPEGIAYKLRISAIKGYNWEDIRMDFYNFSYIKQESFFTSFKSYKILIFMPNRDTIKVEPEDYICKEIQIKKNLISEYFENRILYMFLFKAYYDYGKKKTFEWQPSRIKQPKQKTQPLKGSVSTGMVIIDTWKEQLKEALYNYKKKNYKFGKYWTREQIQDEFLRKKIFVLKAGLGKILFFFTIFPLILFLISLILYFSCIIWNGFVCVISLVPFMVGIWWVIFFNSILFLALRRFLVISPSGVYYQQFIRNGFISWNNISKIEGIIRDAYPIPKEFALIKIYLLSGKKLRFASNWYKNKEFSKEVYMEMFFNLFDLNFRISK